MDDAKALKDILETVVFIKDHAASKEDLKRFATKEDLTALEGRMASKEDLTAFATKEDLQEMKGEIMTHLDALVVLHKKLDEERVASQANFDRLAKQVRRIAGHVHLQLEGV